MSAKPQIEAVLISDPRGPLIVKVDAVDPPPYVLLAVLCDDGRFGQRKFFQTGAYDGAGRPVYGLPQ